MVSFVDSHKTEYGVESICKQLPIAPSTFYQHIIREADPDRLPLRAKRDIDLSSARSFAIVSAFSFLPSWTPACSASSSAGMFSPGADGARVGPKEPPLSDIAPWNSPFASGDAACWFAKDRHSLWISAERGDVALKKGFAAHMPAQDASKGVLLPDVARLAQHVISEGIGVKGLIAHIFVYATMVFVRAWFCGEVYDAAGKSAILRRDRIGVHPEFTNGILCGDISLLVLIRDIDWGGVDKGRVKTSHSWTARSRTSGEYLVLVVMTLSSQIIESPANPGRFSIRIVIIALSIPQIFWQI